MKGVQDYYITGTYTCPCGKVLRTTTVFLDADIRVMGMANPGYDLHIVASDVQTKYFDRTERLPVKDGRLFCPKCAAFIDVAV